MRDDDDNEDEDDNRRLAAIVKQLEFYFSPANLARDAFLQQQMDPAGFVDTERLATFPKLRALLRHGADDLRVAVETSSSSSSSSSSSGLLELNETGTAIRSKAGGAHNGDGAATRSVKRRRMAHFPAENTVFVRELDSRVTEEILFELFLQVGPVHDVYIPSSNTDRPYHRRYGFVEFEDGPLADASHSVAFAKLVLDGIKLFGRAIQVSAKLENDGNGNQPKTPQIRLPPVPSLQSSSAPHPTAPFRKPYTPSSPSSGVAYSPISPGLTIDSYSQPSYYNYGTTAPLDNTQWERLEWERAEQERRLERERRDAERRQIEMEIDRRHEMERQQILERERLSRERRYDRREEDYYAAGRHYRDDEYARYDYPDYYHQQQQQQPPPPLRRDASYEYSSLEYRLVRDPPQQQQQQQQHRLDYSWESHSQEPLPPPTRMPLRQPLPPTPPPAPLTTSMAANAGDGGGGNVMDMLFQMIQTNDNLNS